MANKAKPTGNKTNRNEVKIVQEVTTAISVGNDQYLIKSTADGRGVNVQNKQGNLFIPYGQAGKAIVESLTKQVETGSGRTRRRTAAEILAQKGE